MKTGFMKIDFTPGECPVFSYRTGMLVYEEHFKDGTLLPSGYNTAGYPLDTLQCFPTRLCSNAFYEPSAFSIELDGQCTDYSLAFESFEVTGTEGSAEGILNLRSEIMPVRIKIHTIIDGTGMLRRFFEIENLSDKKINLSRLCLISGGLENMQKSRFMCDSNIEKYYSIGYFEDTRWAREGQFRWRDVQPDTLSLDTRFGRDRFRHPMVLLRNNITGTTFFYQTGYSGGCRFSVDYNANAECDDTYISLCAEITSYKPIAIIGAHETLTTPEIHFGAVSGDFDDCINEMHAHTRKFLPEAKLLVGFGMGAEHDMTPECTKTLMRQAKEMGAEAFLIDAGWYCPPDEQTRWGEYCGDNCPHPQRYPLGIDELRDYCHSLGMKFCLWADIENIGDLSAMKQKHPEWFARDIYGRNDHSLIDMTNPEAAEWCENELARMIEEYGLDMLRVDNNGSVKSCFGIADTGECLSLKRFDAICKMYDRLKKRFPDVIFENCAGGGGRTDLGLMRYFSHSWVSDNQRAPLSVLITNGMTMALPPEKVDRLFAGMGCHEQGTLRFHMRNTMLCHMSLNTLAPYTKQVNPLQMELVKHSVDIYKSFIRDFLPSSKIFHHTPEAENGFVCIEAAAEDKSKMAAAVFTVKRSEGDFIFTPKGIDAGCEYTVTLDNTGEVFTAEGRQLITHGIKIKIPNALDSELILMKKRT